MLDCYILILAVNIRGGKHPFCILTWAFIYFLKEGSQPLGSSPFPGAVIDGHGRKQETQTHLLKGQIYKTASHHHSKLMFIEGHKYLLTRKTGITTTQRTVTFLF